MVNDHGLSRRPEPDGLERQEHRGHRARHRRLSVERQLGRDRPPLPDRGRLGLHHGGRLAQGLGRPRGRQLARTGLGKRLIPGTRAGIQQTT